MHSTKTEILALLKRADGASVDELSTSLGLAPMTVRQHLTALERDALVSAREIRRATGRPHFEYRLTDDGHRSVAQGYDRLLSLLVEAASGLPGMADQARQMFRDAAAALGARHAAEVHASSGSARGERVIALLRSHGGFAEYHETDGRIEIRDFSCVFRTTVSATGPCDWHEALLSALLGEPPEPAPQPGDGCASCCTYIIPARTVAPAGNRGYG